MLSNPLQQRAVARNALVERHRQGPFKVLRHLINVIGIDDQRLLHFVRGAGEARQHQHTGVFFALGGDEFLGYQIHAVA